MEVKEIHPEADEDDKGFIGFFGFFAVMGDVAITTAQGKVVSETTLIVSEFLTGQDYCQGGLIGRDGTCNGSTSLPCGVDASKSRSEGALEPVHNGNCVVFGA